MHYLRIGDQMSTYTRLSEKQRIARAALQPPSRVRTACAGPASVPAGRCQRSVEEILAPSFERNTGRFGHGFQERGQILGSETLAHACSKGRESILNIIVTGKNDSYFIQGREDRAVAWSAVCQLPAITHHPPEHVAFQHQMITLPAGPRRQECAQCYTQPELKIRGLLPKKPRTTPFRDHLER